MVRQVTELLLPVLRPELSAIWPFETLAICTYTFVGVVCSSGLWSFGQVGDAVLSALVVNLSQRPDSPLG